MIQSFQTAFQPSSPPPEQHQPHVDPKVDPLFSLPISSPRSSSSPGESLDSSNQEAKKKKKRMTKKKINKQGGNQTNIVTDATIEENSSNQPQKVKFPCMLCKGDHLLRNFPHIPKGIRIVVHRFTSTFIISLWRSYW